MTANAILIRCKQIRPGGTTITMADKSTIKFTPDENGDHVALVSNRDHINRLLSIPEGFEIHFGAEPAPPGPALSAPPLAVVTQGAKPVAPATVATTPTQPEPAQVPADTSDLNALDDEQIKAIYRAEWNKEPHPKAKRETLIAQIEARREESKA